MVNACHVQKDELSLKVTHSIKESLVAVWINKLSVLNTNTEAMLNMGSHAGCIREVSEVSSLADALWPTML